MMTSTAPGFQKRLQLRQEAAKTVLCVGLDPDVKKMPEAVRIRNKPGEPLVFTWMRDIVDETASHASIFKPQLAYWLAAPAGYVALRRLIRYIKERHPDVLVLLDVKVGDIDRTQAQYATAHLDLSLADGVTVNGYMGESTVKSLARAGKAIVGLGRTSDPSGWELQDDRLASGLTVWQRQVQLLMQWYERQGVIEDAGIVMGSAYRDPADPAVIHSEHLYQARRMTNDRVWQLIPGIGTQGGLIQETMMTAYRGFGSVAINSSSGITNASQGPDYAEAAGEAARTAKEAFNNFRNA